LALFQNGSAICRHEVADIASEREDLGLSLSRDNVDIKLPGWRRENGDVVRPLFALEIVPGSVECLGSC
jgi:hypothetical protein